MIQARIAAVVTLGSILFVVSCSQNQTPPDPRLVTSTSGLQANTVKEFSFPGGAYKDGRIRVSSDHKVEKGPQKNVITLQRANDNNVKISCWCTLEGGECSAISYAALDGGVEVGCVSENCASGREPFCFMDIDDDPAGFKIRLAVASRQ